MLQQSISPRKILLTSVTLVWLFSAMRPLVSLHVVLLDELHAALVAPERLLPAVDLLVPLQQVLLDEAHTALAALERPLPGVNEHVPAQVVGAPEGSAAVFADVRFLTRGRDGTFRVSHQGGFGRSAGLPLGFDSLSFWLWPLRLLDLGVVLRLARAAGAALGSAAQQQVPRGVLVQVLQEAQVLDHALPAAFAAAAPQARGPLLARRPEEPPVVVVLRRRLFLLLLAGLLLLDADEGLQEAPGAALRGGGRGGESPRRLLLESHVLGGGRRRGLGRGGSGGGRRGERALRGVLGRRGGRGRPGEAGDRGQAVVEHHHAGGKAGLHGRRPLAAAEEAAAEFHPREGGPGGARP